MKKLTVDFLASAKRHMATIRYGRLFLYPFIIIVIVGGLFSSGIIISQDAEVLNNLPVVGTLRRLITSKDKVVRGEKADRINILLLGMGGKKHEAGYLTDTIIIASFQPSTKKAAMLSIPRDLVIPIPGYGWRKVNSANAIAEFNEENGGEFTSGLISDTFALPIHYYVRIDFDGFSRIVDDFGGINVLVENDINDYSYPIRGKENALPVEDRYEHLQIKKGLQKMGGDLALKYARSRGTFGVEGSDFARAKRQQNVLLAFKDKALSFETFLNPNRVNSIRRALSNNLGTNLEFGEIIHLAGLVKGINPDHITLNVLRDGPGNYLESKFYEGAYILQPKDATFGELRALARGMISGSDISEPIAIDTSQQIEISNVVNDNKNSGSEEDVFESVNIEIQNGTKRVGFAKQTADKLEGAGFNVGSISNADHQQYTQTIIYDLSQGKKPKSRTYIKDLLQASVAVNIPTWLTSDNLDGDSILKPGVIPKAQAAEGTDFLIILGTNTPFEKI